MREYLNDDDFTALFRSYRYTAWRLETRRCYGNVGEDKQFQEWLAGKDPGVEWLRPWLGMVREELAKGKRMERVRIVDNPPSDYLRWELWATPYNLAVGEDIRYLSRDHPIVEELPDEDFWIFDSRTLARFEFDGDDVAGIWLDDTPEAVVTALAARDAAWHHALTYTDYLAARVG